MTAHDNLLIEIGTEEMPPTALRSLMEAFANNIEQGLNDARLAHAGVNAYASPRRLAVVVNSVAHKQEDRVTQQKGPPVRIAFDEDGNPTKAAEAFANKCGTQVEELSRLETDAGAWLIYDLAEQGLTLEALLPEIVQAALAKLPIPRRMRWGNGDAEFVRPVHWLILLHGTQLIDGQVLNIQSGQITHGHRVHAPEPITVQSADSYLEQLKDSGYVIADFAERRELIQKAVINSAKDAGGVAVFDDDLLDEVTALTEWPVAVCGYFDDAFLALPDEVIESTLTGHQRYFPLKDNTGKLLPRFITLANLLSDDPDTVREGNERVIRPRLADASYFWQTDKQTPLAEHVTQLKNVVYQQKLGTLYDKSQRVAQITKALSEELHADTPAAMRAAELAKCDLVTGMVFEFTELQGIMGAYYATESGESETVATAIAEHYQPRWSGDELPQSEVGQIIAVADKLDTIAGAFVTNNQPTGNRDPFGLRRAALGVIRILVEKSLPISPEWLVNCAVQQQPEQSDTAVTDILKFINERFRHYLQDQNNQFTSDKFAAVMAAHPDSYQDALLRMQAVAKFSELPAASILAEANKRTANLLAKSELDAGSLSVDAKQFAEDAEQQLFASMQSASNDVAPLQEANDYDAVLQRLASLAPDVENFFDQVLVMSDDLAVRNNRLALLQHLNTLFKQVADIGLLQLKND